MTEQTPAVTISHPPEGLLRAVNPAVKFLLGTPLGGGIRRQMMVLNFTGRKSGREFSVPVSAHRIDNALYALASAGWTANFRDGANGSTCLREPIHRRRTVVDRARPAMRPEPACPSARLKIS